MTSHGTMPARPEVPAAWPMRACTGALLVLLASLTLLSAPGRAAAAPHPIWTGVQEEWVQRDPANSNLALKRIHQAGARYVRIDLSWDRIAPAGDTKPAGFDASNPGDPGYHWNAIDGAVLRTVANGLEPFINVSEAPTWAERGAGGRQGIVNPDPAEFAAFAHAAALRYSGTYGGLPRVGAWEAWNEVNASFFFLPQWKGKPGKDPLSPVLYRRLVNAFSDAVHGVNPSNLVVAGSLYPFALDRPNAQAIPPMRFMRELFCISKRLHVKPNCGEPLRFDVWSHHPYTSGSPTHPTASPESVSIGQLGRMGRLLRAAAKQGRVVSPRPVEFWVTEFGWDTNPPDPNGVPIRLHARWVAESLYRMWNAGVTVASWFLLRDGIGDDARFDDGLYLACPSAPNNLSCDKAKLSLEAFRFPFVAFRTKRAVKIWGRTPGGAAGTVVVEASGRHGWKQVLRTPTDAFGIFERSLSKRGHGRRGSLRARLEDGSASSLPFSLKRPRDFPISPPVG